MRKMLLFILIFCMSINNINAELYHDQKPKYADNDFIKPTEMIQLEQIEHFQILVIISMLFVNALKIFGTFLAIRHKKPNTIFDPSYIISGLLGLFVGYTAYMATGPTMDTTYVNIFMEAGFYALGANLMFDFAGKVKEKLS